MMNDKVKKLTEEISEFVLRRGVELDVSYSDLYHAMGLVIAYFAFKAGVRGERKVERNK